MSVYADLHTHSTCSDGTKSPEEVVDLALARGLRAVAVTDHDNLGGSRAAVAHARGGRLAIDVVPGVEISTQTDGRDVHLLGYFVDLYDAGLDEAFERSRERRRLRACRIADNMAAAGFDVSGEELLASGKTPNRSNLARLLAEKGYCRDINDAFDRLIGDDSPYFVPNEYLETSEAIGLVRAAGGRAFVAHPAPYGVVDLIGRFRNAGMFGLEAFHTLQSADDTRELLGLAAELGLAVSGGSDWHGDAAHGSELGGAGLDEERYRAFLAACGRA